MWIPRCYHIYRSTLVGTRNRGSESSLPYTGPPLPYAFSLSTRVEVKAFDALVKPRLCYASEVWNPTTLTDISRLELPTTGGTLCRCWLPAHIAMLSTLNWTPLRTDHRPVFLYVRHDHHLKYTGSTCSVNCYRCLFYPGTTKLQNRQSPDTVASMSRHASKSRATVSFLAMSPLYGVDSLKIYLFCFLSTFIQWCHFYQLTDSSAVRDHYTKYQTFCTGSFSESIIVLCA